LQIVGFGCHIRTPFDNKEGNNIGEGTELGNNPVAKQDKKVE
jgi:hypothetical protein